MGHFLPPSFGDGAWSGVDGTLYDSGAITVIGALTVSSGTTVCEGGRHAVRQPTVARP
jgi:hypothetical protein